MYKIVLIRHGESDWNKKDLFTGWTDVDLTPLGATQAKEAGILLRDKKYSFDVCYASFLKRAIKTSNIILEEMNLMWIPTIKDWRLNERHYGNLQGLNKKEMAEKFGEEQVLVWRRSYDIAPPEIKKSNPFNQLKDPRYAFLKKPVLCESLKDVVLRTTPFWDKVIIPELKKGKKILLAASGNSLRAIIKRLNNISDKDIANYNIPCAIPMVYELDKNFKVKKWYYLGDEKKISAMINAVKNQGKIKK